MFKSLSAALLWLHNQGSAEEIATVLKEAGVKGVRSDVNHCVLAAWLTGEVDDLVRVEVVPDTAPSDGLGRDCGIVNAVWGRGSETFHLPLPRNVARMANMFDEGDLPELDMDPEVSEPLPGDAP